MVKNSQKDKMTILKILKIKNILPIALAKLPAIGSVAYANVSAFSSSGCIRFKIRGCLWSKKENLLVW